MAEFRLFLRRKCGNKLSAFMPKGLQDVACVFGQIHGHGLRHELPVCFCLPSRDFLEVFNIQPGLFSVLPQNFDERILARRLGFRPVRYLAFARGSLSLGDFYCLFLRLRFFQTGGVCLLLNAFRQHRRVYAVYCSCPLKGKGAVRRAKPPCGKKSVIGVPVFHRR